MTKVVAHFIRKSSQLRASFINNQIAYHIDYKPVIVCRYNSIKDNEDFAEFNSKEIPKLNLSVGKIIDINFRYLKKISKDDLRKVLDFLKEHNVTILHFHYGSDACIYSDVIKYSGTPSVVSFYGYDAFSFPKVAFGLGGRMLNSIFSEVDNILAMSEVMRTDLLNIGCPEERIIVHYHGVPIKIFKDLNPKHEKINDKLVMLHSASFDEVKGHTFVFEAIKIILQSGINNFELRLWGKGKLEVKLKKYINKIDIEEHIKFLGTYDYGSKKHLNELENADLFLHPSVISKDDKEGIPGAIVEAMASGLPVISTFHGGIPCIINNNETGLLVKEWDINDLANKIKMLLKDLSLRKRLGQAARNYAIEHLDLHKKEIELENIYNEILLH